MCLSENGKIYAWGGTLYKKLSERGGSVTGSCSDPRLVTSLQDRRIVHIDCGDFHSLALDA